MDYPLQITATLAHPVNMPQPPGGGGVAGGGMPGRNAGRSGMGQAQAWKACPRMLARHQVRRRAESGSSHRERSEQTCVAPWLN